MAGILSRVLCPVLMVAALVSCSIKENRFECPCWLVVCIDGMPEEGIVLSVDGETHLFTERIGNAMEGNYYERKVPRGELSLWAFKGGLENACYNGIYTVAPGNEADSLYSYCKGFESNCDFYVDTVRLCKQFATIGIHVRSSLPDLPLKLRARGNVCGFKLSDSLPIDGAFVCDIELDGSLDGSFRVPRQIDDSLTLEFYDPASGETEYSIPVGRMVVMEGYDWTKANLDDISIMLDYSSMEVTIIIAEWEERDLTEIEI